MLANIPDTPSFSGSLSAGLHSPATFLHELLNFIKEELPKWRDDPDRPSETSETILTSHLCAHLNSATRRSSGWDMLQFRTEEADEENKGRKIDLVPAPCNAKIQVDGRNYTQYDSLMPIECKRLPTPKAKDRDKREYVISQYSSTGGIQRFKAGHHGANHQIGAMIGYVQSESRDFWNKKVREWIEELVKNKQKGWAKEDLLQLEDDDSTLKLSTFHSHHKRENSLLEMELRHLWIEINATSLKPKG
ncbi:MAG: hypothetical protein COB36_02225 [Alphaproteobacteria bacterium]|nr:MAG: hypothetical protein COB36_02225 [Alphaproteobacteria bacterium]